MNQLSGLNQLQKCISECRLQCALSMSKPHFCFCKPYLNISRYRLSVCCAIVPVNSVLQKVTDWVNTTFTIHFNGPSFANNMPNNKRTPVAPASNTIKLVEGRRTTAWWFFQASAERGSIMQKPGEMSEHSSGHHQHRSRDTETRHRLDNIAVFVMRACAPRKRI